jgi:hypothetical protein
MYLIEIFIIYNTDGDISGSHGGEYEDDGLLGCCAVQAVWQKCTNASNVITATITRAPY